MSPPEPARVGGRRVKLGTKITLVMLAMTTFAVMSVAATSYWLARTSLRDSVLQGLENTAVLKAKHIEDLFGRLRADAQIAQDYYNIRTNLPIVAKHAGNPTHPDHVAAKQILDDQLQAWLRVRSEVKNLLLVSPEGRIVYSAEDDYARSHLGRPLPDPGARSFIEGSRDIYVSEVFPGDRSDVDYELLITAPIRDYEGGFAGVLAFEVDMEPVWALVLDRAGLGDTGESLVAVREGDHVLFLNPLRYDSGAALRRKVMFGASTALPVQEAAHGKTGSGVSSDYRGESVVAAWCPLPSLGWGMVAKIDRSEAFAPIRTGAWLTLLATLAGIFVASLLSLLVSRPLSDTLQSLLTVARKSQAGEISVEAEVRSRDEIGELAQVFNSMLQSFREVAEQAKTIAAGDYSVGFTPRSERDELGLALQAMTSTLESTAAAAEAIAAGQRDVAVEVKGERDLLAKSINRMVASLDEAARLNDRHLWMARSQAEINDVVSGNQSLGELGETAVRKLCRMLDAQAGALYVSDEQGLRLAAAVGQPDLPKTWKPGEGLIGRVAQEKQRLIVRDVPVDYLRVASGLGEASPRHLLVIPAMHEGEVRGVLELAALAEFGEAKLEFLELVGPTLGLAISEALARDRIEELLSESQAQTEALQAQQEELRQTNEELADQAQLLEEGRETVEARNREIMRARRQLEAKAEQLSEASRYKSEFLANMSHELRTPLNSLLILAKLLDDRGQNLTTQQREYARAIHSSGVELLELISEILDLAKIEAGKMAVELSDCPLHELEAYLLRSFQPVASERGLAFEVEVDPATPATLRTDIKRVQQVLKNLLANAFKFTSRGGVFVRIGPPGPGFRPMRPNLQTAEAVVGFTVRDTGIGIPADKQALIFEAFAQADTGTSRKYGGTGLGLSICREIVHLLEGELSVESVVDEGTTFVFYLPMSAEDQPGRAPSASPCVSPSSSSTPGALRTRAEAHVDRAELPAQVIPDDRETIGPADQVLLLIEDDLAFARVLVDTAHERGFRVLVAGDGASGLALARRLRPDAILLDLHLPDASGWAIYDQLGRDPATAQVPVHILSAGDPSARPSTRETVAYLQKPSSPEGLREAFGAITAALSGGPKRLLVVEDDEIGRKSMIALLEDTGVEVTGAASGAEALATLAKGDYGCVVLDLGLPDMDGFTLVDKIRADGRWPKLPLIVHTGRDLSHQEELRLQGSADSIIIKNASSPARLIAETSLFLQRVEIQTRDEDGLTRPARDEDEGLVGKRVLIVDDDVRNIFALRSLLEHHGMEVVYAESGAAALELLRSSGSGLSAVLMDIMMPGMDGYETMAAVRALPSFATIPMIAITAKAMKGDRQRCLDAGASDYITKPVDADQLLSLLRVWLYSSGT